MKSTSETLIRTATETIAKEEGLPKGGMADYDPKGQTKLISIGYGHQIKSNELAQGYITIGNETVQLVGDRGINTILTPSQAKALLQTDVLIYIDRASAPFSESTWNSLTDNQKLALTSYAYNVGSTTSLVKAGIVTAIDSGNFEAAAAIIRDKGIKTANGQINSTLVARRKREAEIFLGHSLPSVPVDTPIPSTPATAEVEQYLEQTYRKPFTNLPAYPNRGQSEVFVLKNGEDSLYEKYIKSLKNTVLTKSTINGDIKLLQLLDDSQKATSSNIDNLLNNTLKDFSPEAKYSLIIDNLFEASPDRMRIKMGQTAYDQSTPPHHAHAWRAPGKLAITANITIPGISGFHIGNIFWIDRIQDAYKKFGAFQLFGMTEHININRGWTTELYARYNAIPEKLIAQRLYEDEKTGDSPSTAKEAKPAEPEVKLQSTVNLNPF